MLRDEFIDNVTTWNELVDFCEEEGLSFCDELCGEDSFNEWIDGNLVSWAHEHSWQDLMSMLNNYDSICGADYYLWDDYEGGYRRADDSDFDDIKNTVIEFMDEDSRWDDSDEDEEEEEYEPEPDPDDVEPTPEEDFSFGEMFTAGVGCVRAINEKALEAARQQDKAFAEFANIRVNLSI